MPEVRVVPVDGGKNKVLVNGIQQGITYSSREQADHEAKRIKEGYEKVYKKKSK